MRIFTIDNLQSAANYDKFFIGIVIFLIWATLFTPCIPEVFGGINLPQRNTHIAISDANHATLKRYFSSFKYNPENELNGDTERILCDILPEDHRTGCQDMISYWGSVAEGTGNFSVRVVFIRDTAKKNTKQVLLSYRCFSTYEGYRDQFYDERLAVLLIKPATSSLVLMPHAEDCNNCSDLSHIRFSQTYQRDSAPLVSLLISTSNDNPCCGGPFQSSEERINYYLFHETGVKLVASVIRHREEYAHDDVDGDMKTIYDARITVQKDQKGNITQIKSHYTVRKNGELQQTGKLTYVWNNEKRGFDQTAQ